MGRGRQNTHTIRRRGVCVCGLPAPSGGRQPRDSCAPAPLPPLPGAPPGTVPREGPGGPGGPRPRRGRQAQVPLAALRQTESRRPHRVQLPLLRAEARDGGLGAWGGSPLPGVSGGSHHVPTLQTRHAQRLSGQPGPAGAPGKPEAPPHLEARPRTPGSRWDGAARAGHPRRPSTPGRSSGLLGAWARVSGLPGTALGSRRRGDGPAACVCSVRPSPGRGTVCLSSHTGQTMIPRGALPGHCILLAELPPTPRAKTPAVRPAPHPAVCVGSPSPLFGAGLFSFIVSRISHTDPRPWVKVWLGHSPLPREGGTAVP